MNNTVAKDLIRIHIVITRAIVIGIEKCQIFKNNGKIDDVLKEGFINYLNSLLSLFHSHHLVEDDLIFPYFKNKQFDAPYEIMATQHGDLLPLLDELEICINNLNSNSSNQEFIDNLLENLEQIQQAWIPHYQLEEEYLNDQNISNLISDEEQQKQCLEFGEYAGKHLEPDYLVIPFILYNLPLKERELMAEVFPPEIIQDLIPHEWKEKWQSMSPFFLI
ncbi:hypothetical protein GM3708_2149 [Geminocystis sp. NIES-3708]|uniref:hemerythrin domain-containing protein n=1 Tax=Geminocystis sp. NIES-3708 TaxID=1615909 RepID=UPI0005FC3F03|nr:hemerythrin domain-containing protein [Geminocystis sp. NIES-3708]BAQ61743.1 hypothetical protein GM3708_2149 [Geminocystis sp. NIES-3708]